jgi:uncharacterized DUF497 family protein
MAKFEFSEWLLRWLFSGRAFEFIWDEGNSTKSSKKHGVEIPEAEEVFDDTDICPLGIQVDPPVQEPRFGVLGKSHAGRGLHVVFVIRMGHIRVVSARPMHRKERAFYEQASGQE